MFDLVLWALAAPLPSSRSIGSHAVGRVLVALAVHADREGICWPSAETIAREVSGLTRRDVRNALDALLDAGLIAVDGAQVRGRVTRWRLLAGHPATLRPELAGYPATSEPARPEGLAGHPATSATATPDSANLRDSAEPEAAELAGNMAGELAGNMAGNMAGYPAPKRTEQNLNLNNTRSSAARPTPCDLPDNWQPNDTHRKVAEALELDVEETAQSFRLWAVGQRRSDWAGVFGAYLRDAAEGLLDRTFT